MEAGLTIDELIKQFPVTRVQLDSLMAFVARSLEKSLPTASQTEMRILFDNGTPRGVARFLTGHTVD